MDFKGLFELQVPPTVTSISVLLTNDAEIREINKVFRKKDKSTDVLSFAYLEDPKHGDFILGDLVISLETTARQAPKYGLSFDGELTRLIVHGLLHLAGYDHEGVSKAKAEKMRRVERSIFREISDRNLMK